MVTAHLFKRFSSFIFDTKKRTIKVTFTIRFKELKKKVELRIFCLFIVVLDPSYSGSVGGVCLHQQLSLDVLGFAWIC